jgi:hypothetical protein
MRLAADGWKGKKHWTKRSRESGKFMPTDGAARGGGAPLLLIQRLEGTPRSYRDRKDFAMEAARYATIAEIVVAEKINDSYVGRVLRLTLLAPDIVEAILGGRQPAKLQVKELLRRFPVGWREQRAEMLDQN